MNLTERQGEILNKVVADYIDLAFPISSEFLEKKHKFGICPASIRIEMQRLTEAGFISQPYTSAGRVPTDKGYRFFVDSLLERGLGEEDFGFGIENLIGDEFEDTIKFVQSVTKNLANLSSNLILGYLSNEKILWKEGWEKVLQEPEFKETKLVSNLAEFVNGFEKELEELKENSEIKVYIGKENPFPKAKEFSIIISNFQFPKKDKGVLAIAGPKRMSYEKNISSLNYLTKLLEEF